MWGNTRVEDVEISAERRRSLSAADKEKRRAVFCVVVHLHWRGLLDASNEPTAAALQGTARACGALPQEDALQLKNRYIAGSLNYREAFTVVGGVAGTGNGMPAAVTSSDVFPTTTSKYPAK
jgi:hypothetical protein